MMVESAGSGAFGTSLLLCFQEPSLPEGKPIAIGMQ